MADTWHLFVSNAGDEAASSDGGIDSRSSSPEVSDAASCIASQHVCGRLWSLDLCLPHLPMLPLSLAEARRPPRPHRLPRFLWCSIAHALLHKLRENGSSCALWFLLSMGQSCSSSSVMQCNPWSRHCGARESWTVMFASCVEYAQLFLSLHKSSLAPLLAC